MGSSRGLCYSKRECRKPKATRRRTFLQSSGALAAPVPERVDQYVQAFEKVWAHRRELGTV